MKKYSCFLILFFLITFGFSEVKSLSVSRTKTYEILKKYEMIPSNNSNKSNEYIRALETFGHIKLGEEDYPYREADYIGVYDDGKDCFLYDLEDNKNKLKITNCIKEVLFAKTKDTSYYPEKIRYAFVLIQVPSSEKNYVIRAKFDGISSYYLGIWTEMRNYSLSENTNEIIQKYTTDEDLSWYIDKY